MFSIGRSSRNQRIKVTLKKRPQRHYSRPELNCHKGPHRVIATSAGLETKGLNRKSRKSNRRRQSNSTDDHPNDQQVLSLQRWRNH